MLPFLSSQQILFNTWTGFFNVEKQLKTMYNADYYVFLWGEFRSFFNYRLK